MDKKSNTRTCLKCGWVAFGVTRGFAEGEVKRFNKYFDSLTEEKRQENYNNHKSSIESYEKCYCCGGSYTNFRESCEGDCPIGVTMNPIIVEGG